MRECCRVSRGIMVGDADSVIVIPAEIADEVAAEATEMTAYEDFAIEQVRAGQSIIGYIPQRTQKIWMRFRNGVKRTTVSQRR